MRRPSSRLPFRRLLRLLAPALRRDEVEHDLETSFQSRAQRSGRVAAVLGLLLEAAGLLRWRWTRSWSMRGGATTLGGGGGAPYRATATVLRDAARSLRRRPAVPAISILILGVAVAACTVVTSLSRAVLWQPLPYANIDRLLFVTSTLEQGEYLRAPLSGPELVDLQTRAPGIDQVAGIWATSGGLVGDGDPVVIDLGLVTANFFEVLGIEPELGRWFVEEEAVGGSPIVLSHTLWRERFGADPDLLGEQIRIEGGWGFGGGTYQVIGIAPPALVMSLPSDSGVPAHLQAWTPFGFDLAYGNRTSYYIRTVTTLTPGTDVEQVRAELAALGEALVDEHVDYAASGRTFQVEPLHEGAVRSVRPLLLLLLVAVALVMLVAFANVAGLLASRALERQSELTIRQAVGASPSHIRWQLVLESGLIALIASALGLTVGIWATDALAVLLPEAVRPELVSSQPLTLIVLASASLLFGVAAGAGPAVRTPGIDHRGRGLERRSARGRTALLVAQSAVCATLVLGSSLLLRTVDELRRADIGFDTEKVVTAGLSLPLSRYDSAEAIADFGERLEGELRAIPGVVSAGLVNQLPYSDSPNWSTTYRTRGEAEDSPGHNEADARLVSPGYLRTLGAQIVVGRPFTEGDRLGTQEVAIIDEQLARSAWPSQDPLDREIEVSAWRAGEGFQPVWARVVGVVRHLRHRDPSAALREQVYLPLLQQPRNQLAVALRIEIDDETVIGPARAALARIDPAVALEDPQPLAVAADAATARQRWAARGTTCFTLFALLLAATGLYAQLSQEVRSRRAELAVHLALGATSARLRRDVLMRGLTPVVLGLFVGLPLAVLTLRPAEQLLYGVTLHDPLSHVASICIVVSIGILAALLPMREAFRVAPTESLGRAT